MICRQDVVCWVLLGKWHIEHVRYWRCEDVGNVGCSGCWNLLMWDVGDVGCLGCEMFGMWDVQDVECSGCGMFVMWNARDVQCPGYGTLGV